jgi:hypothetical protein
MKLFKHGVVVFIVLAMFNTLAWGAEESATKGYAGSTPIRTKTVTHADGSSTTRGYIGNQRIRTKTVVTASGTKTTGYIGTERIRVKTKKD